MKQLSFIRPFSRALRFAGAVTCIASLTLVAPAMADDNQPPTTEPTTAAAPQPFLSEIAPASAPGAPAWFEIAAPTTRASIGGWMVSDEDGHTFTLPRDLPALPPSATLVVVLGAGQDDLDPRDGTMKLHTHALPANTFGRDGDQLALYRSTTRSPQNLVDFVAWGTKPGREVAMAAAARRWSLDQYIYYDQGFGNGTAASPPVPNASLGRWKNIWVAYASTSSTPGHRNPPPTPLRSNVPEGTTFAADSVSIAWTSVEAAGIHFVFELSDRRDFGRTLLRTRTTAPMWSPKQPLPAGDYFWRVKMVDSDGNASPSGKPQGMTVLRVDPKSPKVTKTLLKPEHYRIQRKDTTMLEIGGASTNLVNVDDALSPWSYYTGLTNIPGDTRNRWDGPHVVSTVNSMPSYSLNNMDNMYCVRASVAMLNAFYGGSLTEDRISYYRFEEAAPDDFEGKGKPEFDLGFRRGIGEYAWHEQTLEWAIGAETEAESFCSEQPTDTDWTCPFADKPAQITWQKVKDLIDSGRPFMTTSYNNGHMRVVDGYRILHDGTRMVQLLDPVPSSADAGPAGVPRWITYDTFKNNNSRIYYLKSGETVTPKQHNSAISKDSDGDGINDFDEIARFKTMTNYEDSDYDWLDDKEEIISYVFFGSSAESNYVPGILYDYLHPNIDGDAYRMERDWDNDNDKAPDGCEDANGSGTTEYDKGETSPFNAPSVRACIPRMRVTFPAAGAKLDAGPYNKPKSVMLHLDMELPESLASNNLIPTFKASEFNIRVGNRKAAITAIQQLGDTSRVMITLPTQFQGGIYNLTVHYTNNAGTVTKTVVDAFKYTELPVVNP